MAQKQKEKKAGNPFGGDTPSAGATLQRKTASSEPLLKEIDTALKKKGKKEQYVKSVLERCGC